MSSSKSIETSVAKSEIIIRISLESLMNEAFASDQLTWLTSDWEVISN